MRKCLCGIFVLLTVLTVSAQDKFCIAKDGKTATIIVDKNDWKGVIRAANDLGDDVRKVTGVAAPVEHVAVPQQHAIIAGTIGKNNLIDKLIKQKKLDIKRIKGHWEGYCIDIVDGNLVIAGNDKRGTIYGIYEISKRIGVSPWYWMADAPVVHQDELYYDEGRICDWPAVKYRGIFINDEWPSFGTWCTKHFGGINSKAYEKPKEMPISFIMDYAWNPESVGAGDEQAWLENWVASVLGGLTKGDVREAADIIAQYSKLNLMRKPEVQVPGLFNYEEMLHLNNQWQSIILRCETLKEWTIPAAAQDAFYQLVYYPAVASAGVAMMYNAATMGDSITVCRLMTKDQQLTYHYNNRMAGGKWDGMMLDNHIGYTQWSIPDQNRYSYFGAPKRQ